MRAGKDELWESSLRTSVLPKEPVPPVISTRLPFSAVNAVTTPPNIKAERSRKTSPTRARRTAGDPSISHVAIQSVGPAMDYVSG